LDHAVRAVIDGTVAWVSDIDPGACKILAHHWPQTPNLGDITAVDWASVEPVDVITGGFPCQDVSQAGRRAGLRPGSRSGLWGQMVRAIETHRPALVVAENVEGLLGADGHADVEPCSWCVDHVAPEHRLRALGVVLGDLADIGFDAAWHSLSASDIGAPHGRFRVFIVAWPADSQPWRVGRDGRWVGPGSAAGVGASRETHRLGQGHAATADADDAAFGIYAPAVRRWERVTRPAPSPVVTNRNGRPQLNLAFDEWLMGLPAGHITGVPGIGRKEALKLCGNGVVPQQAETAIRHILGALAVAA